MLHQKNKQTNKQRPKQKQKQTKKKELVGQIEKVIDRATQTPLCDFVVGARGPPKFCSDENVFEQFLFFV